MSRISQQRYRERQKQRWSELEKTAARMEEMTVNLKHLKEENVTLRATNKRMEAKLREQQAHIALLLAGQPGPAVPGLGESDFPYILEGRPACVTTPNLESLSLTSMAIPYMADASTSTSTARTPLTEMAAQIQALKNFLWAESIFMGGIQLPEEAARTLVTMLASAGEAAIGVVRSKAPLPSELSKTHLQVLDMELTPMEAEKFETCVAVLNLSRMQKCAIRDLRLCQAAILEGVHEERARLNSQTRTLLKELGHSTAHSNEMKQVWAGLRQNVQTESNTIADGLRSLLFSILEPVQAALLLVDAGLEGVQVMKLATAVMTHLGDSPGTTGAGSPFDA